MLSLRADVFTFVFFSYLCDSFVQMNFLDSPAHSLVCRLKGFLAWGFKGERGFQKSKRIFEYCQQQQQQQQIKLMFFFVFCVVSIYVSFRFVLRTQFFQTQLRFVFAIVVVAVVVVGGSVYSQNTDTFVSSFLSAQHLCVSANCHNYRYGNNKNDKT